MLGLHPQRTQQDQGLLLLTSGPRVRLFDRRWARRASSLAASVAGRVRDRVCRWWFFLVLR
jgi:hypothetical protein